MLRLKLVQVAAALALFAAAAILICAGLGLCLWGAYVGISATMGPSGAAFFIGLLSLVAAGLLTWTAIVLTR